MYSPHSGHTTKVGADNLSCVLLLFLLVLETLLNGTAIFISSYCLSGAVNFANLGSMYSSSLSS